MYRWKKQEKKCDYLFLCVPAMKLLGEVLRWGMKHEGITLKLRGW